MAMAALFDSPPTDRLEDAILFALDKTGRTGITIKPEQREAIYNLAVVGRDVLDALPNGLASHY